MDWRNYPLLLPATCLIAGILLAEAHIDRMSMLWLLYGSGIAVTTMLGCMVKKPTPLDMPGILRSRIFGIAKAVLFLLAGMALYTGHSKSMSRLTPRDSSVCQGVISAAAREKARSWALNIQLDNGARIVTYIGKSKSDPDGQQKDIKAMNVGDTLTVMLKHVTPTDRRGDSFDTYRRRLMNRGICATAYVPPHMWRHKACKAPLTASMSANNLQHVLHNIYEEHDIDGEEGSIIEAMTIGRTAGIDQQTRTIYSRAGGSHLLALSGFHVGIVMMMLLLLTRFFLQDRTVRIATNVSIIAAIWGYAYIAGMSPSLMRATIACTVVLSGHILDRFVKPINVCLTCLMIMLCIAPADIFNIGFQLSFLAVTGICVTSNRIEEECSRLHRGLRIMANTVAISFVCSLMTAPVVAHHFGCVPLFSVVTNLLSVAFVYVIVCGCALWWSTLWIDPVNNVIGSAVTWAAKTMNTLMEWIAHLPSATIELRPDTTTICIYYLILTIATYKILQKTKNRNIQKWFDNTQKI